MIIATFGKHTEDSRAQMLVGITTEDLAVLVQHGHVYLNKDEPEEKPLPCHLILMFGPDDESLNERISAIAGIAQEDSSNDESPDV